MTRSDPFEQSYSQDVPDHRTHENLEQPKFEEVYPRYEFSELVRLFLALVTWLQDRRRRRTRGAFQPSGERSTGGPHAEA